MKIVVTDHGFPDLAIEEAIVRYGIGVDNVDLDAARSRGIPVCNIPDYCIDEVADHTLAFILALTRQVAPQSRLVHDGQLKIAAPPTAFRTLAAMTCGVVGFGRICRGVVRRPLASIVNGIAGPRAVSA